jgi:hypothetical protein
MPCPECGELCQILYGSPGHCYLCMTGSMPGNGGDPTLTEYRLDEE